MSNIDDGGAAFPHPNLNYDGNWDRNKAIEGMTLRDYFAATALTGFLANPSNEFVKFHEVASDAYNTADQMLKARKEGA